MTRRALWILALGALTGAALPAQVTVVDEGIFSISADGQRVGREDFSIRAVRGAGGAAFVAQGTVLGGERRELVALNIDSLGRPVRFQLERREGETVVETYQGVLDRGVWTGRLARTGGESARELRLPAAGVPMEADVLHHLWFLLRVAQTGPVLTYSPRTLVQEVVTITDMGPDSVALGRRYLPAHRWEVRPAAGGEVLWELWADSRRRLLRVRDARRGLDAIRDEAPPP